MATIRNRLDRLEAAAHERTRRDYYAFMERFTDADIDALIDGTASPELVDRWEPAIDLTLPPEIEEKVQEILANEQHQ